MTEDDDSIPTIGEHRGVGLHDCQSPDRLAGVSLQIDVVLDQLTDIAPLLDVCGDFTWAPEARLLAAAKLRAMYEMSAEDRTVRPNIDLRYVSACVAGLDSQKWRSPWAYCSLLDPGPAPGAKGPVRRDPFMAGQLAGRFSY